MGAQIERTLLVRSGTDTDSSGAVSPDGRLLAYTNWDTGDLAVRDLRSGQSRMVTNKGGKWTNDDHAFKARWSPHGKQPSGCTARRWSAERRQVVGAATAAAQRLRRAAVEA